MRARPFDNRLVVVTGGTGDLGSAVVESLLAAGAVCHVPSRSGGSSEKLDRLAGERLHVHPGVDLGEEGAVRKFYEELPGLWASIHCAGGFAMAALTDLSAKDFDAMISANVRSAFLCCREAVRKIRAASHEGGRIVNVAARPALEPRTGSGMVAYAASKAAVGVLTEALGEELAPEGIWVNAVAPSILDTPGNRRAMPKANHAKWPSAGDVAETIVFLASPSNRVTRGSVVAVYGKS